MELVGMFKTYAPFPIFYYERSEYNNQVFIVPSRYQLQKILGQGAYGVVVSALDRFLNTEVAIKKVPLIFDNRKEYLKRILREIRIMKHFRNHPNIISLQDLILPPSFDAFNEIYFVTEKLHCDLRVLMAHQKLSDSNIKLILYNILKGLKYIHSVNVIHRDLKPSNILIGKNNQVKLCDFGLSRAYDDNQSMTLYVVTRYYRAPELILEWNKSHTQIDIWSAGCIFSEMLEGGKILFRGDHFKEQLQLILGLTGTPDMQKIKASQEAKEYISKLPYSPKQDFSKRFPSASPLAVDLLEKMLQFDPDDRISAQQALEHPYFQDLRNKQEEIDCTHSFEHIEQMYPNSSSIDYKKLIYDEIVKYNEESQQSLIQQAIQSPELAQWINKLQQEQKQQLMEKLQQFENSKV